MPHNGLAGPFRYRIDAADAIAFVDQAWIRFAVENQAPDLTGEAVVGRPIWQFIAGEETRRLYRELFGLLRASRSELNIPFRCDSPTTVRQMTLTLRSAPKRGIEFEGWLVEAQARPPVAVFSRWAERSEEFIAICSLCRRLSILGEWVDAAEAITRGRLFNAAPVPRLAESICAECRHLGGIP